MKRCRLVCVVKLTTFLAPYENVLITCCLNFQVIRGSVFCVCQYGDAKLKLEILEEFFLWIRLGVLRISTNYVLREIPKTRFMDFGLLYENDKGEYVVLNHVRMADIRLASLVYLLVFVSTCCVPIALLRQNKPFRLLYLGHAQIMSLVPLGTNAGNLERAGWVHLARWGSH